MTTLFLGDLDPKTTKNQLAIALGNISTYENFILTRHKSKKKKILFFDVKTEDIEKYLMRPLKIHGVEHYPQLSQNQPNLDPRILNIQKKRLYVHKVPRSNSDSIDFSIEKFFKLRFGEDSVLSFFSVKTRGGKSKGYGFLHLTDEETAQNILRLGTVQFKGKTIEFKKFIQKFKVNVKNQIRKIPEKNSKDFKVSQVMKQKTEIIQNQNSRSK